MRETLRSAPWLLLATAVALLVALWPQSLGGSVAYVRVQGHSMLPTLHEGDLVVVRRQAHYRVGDPVAYRIPVGQFGAGALVVHRLVGGDGARGYVTQGDAKPHPDEWHPRDADVLGRVRYDLPRLGTTVAALTRPVYAGGLMAGMTVLATLPRRRREERQPAT